MDDYNLGILIESKNEWCARLINILVPSIIEGFNSIFQDAYNMCIENDEESKYLMTFQNLLNNISKWSQELVENEKQRIITDTGCPYLEDLLTCVHIIQLKSLSCVRVGTENKKIDIDIPNVNIFIHKLYINAARKIYINIYLFEKDIQPLQIQKNNRELELIIKEAILDTVRSNIPIDNILKAYLDERQETDVKVVEKEEVIVDEEAIKKTKQEEERNKEREKIREEIRQEFILKEKTDRDNSLEKINQQVNSVLDTPNPMSSQNSLNVNLDTLDLFNRIDNDNDKDKQPSVSENNNQRLDLDLDLNLDIEDLTDKSIDNDKFNNDNIELDIEEL
tara:strand:+ start:1555 stop:2562 length:1008 start_codon:yes stop_codon:yes gene_type:complete